MSKALILTLCISIAIAIHSDYASAEKQIPHPNPLPEGEGGVRGNEDIPWVELVKESRKLFLENKHTEAINAAENAIEIAQKKFGAQHPNLAMPLNNIADIYSGQEKYEEAEALYKKALVILEEFFGPDHPDLAKFINNLATFYYYQKKYAQAELLLKQALSIYKKRYDKDHPGIAAVMDNLAALYESQKKYAEADTFKKLAMEISYNATEKYHLAGGVRYPKRYGKDYYIFDGANMLTSGDSNTLKSIIEMLFNEKKISLFVVSIKSLASYGAVGWDLETYAAKLLEKWGPQRNGINHKILLLSSRDDRLVCIEVEGEWSQGEETHLNKIKEDLILMNFRKGKFSKGILAGVSGLNDIINEFFVKQK